MLKNRYQEILVGVGPMSLIRGIISRKRNRSTLLIDDKRFFNESYAGHFLSELEILALLRVGKKYEIPELQDIRQFLAPAELEVMSDQTRLKLGSSPLKNFRSVLRKYPELLDSSNLDDVYRENEEEFNRNFSAELARFESHIFETSQRPKGYKFEIQGPQWVKTIFERFRTEVNRGYDDSKDLKYSAFLHLLGLAHEEKLKTSLGMEEIPFYFFRTFSGLFRLQDFFLSTQLKRRLVLLGGDYKESSVQYWQFFNNQFENLLLASFEGVITGERVLFFSHLPSDVPFNVESEHRIFKKTQLCPVKRMTTPFPPTSLTFMTTTSQLGSEEPFRVIARGKDFSYYHWAYPMMPGSKPEFYKDQVMKNFAKDSEDFPLQETSVEMIPTGSVTLDLRQYKSDKKSWGPVLQKLPFEIESQGKAIRGFEYWGPFRYRSFGLLGLIYGVEGN